MINDENMSLIEYVQVKEVDQWCRVQLVNTVRKGKPPYHIMLRIIVVQGPSTWHVIHADHALMPWLASRIRILYQTVGSYP
jgi:hypothetical protein